MDKELIAFVIIILLIEIFGLCSAIYHSKHNLSGHRYSLKHYLDYFANDFESISVGFITVELAVIALYFLYALALRFLA